MHSNLEFLKHTIQFPLVSGNLRTVDQAGDIEINVWMIKYVIMI